MAKTIAVSILADTKELQQNLSKAEGSLKDFGSTADREAKQVNDRFDSIGEGADHMASASSQAAGGLGDLGGALSLIPGPLGALGSGMEAAAPAIMGLTGASDLLNLATEKFPILAKLSAVASKVMAVGMNAVGVAVRFATGPFGIALLAIAAVTAGLILAYKKSETFRDIVNGAFQMVKTGASLLWAGIKLYFGLYIGAIKSVINFAGNMKDKIVDGFHAVVNFIKGVPDKISALGGRFKEAGSALMHKIVDGIKSAAGFIGNIASGIWNAVKSLLNQGIDKINAALEFDINLGVKTFHVNAPNIPHLARGGITTGPTLALIGDNPGGREAVIPLDKYDPFGSKQTVYNITVNTGVGDPVAIGKELKRVIALAERHGVK